jgi:hypothetical protein
MYIGVGVAGLDGNTAPPINTDGRGRGGFISGGAGGVQFGVAGLSYINGGNGGNSERTRYGGGGGGYGGGGGGGGGLSNRNGGGGGGSFSTDINSTFSLGNVSTIADGTALNGYVEILLFLPPPCFLVGSKILTDQGYKAIETLRKGDFVKTSLDGYKPIVLLGKSELNHPALFADRIKDQLYVCSPAMYPELSADLVLTGGHSILVNEFVSQTQKEKTFAVNNEIYITDNKYRLPACVDERTTVFPVAGTYTIYHLALENEQYTWNYGIYANGLLVESCSERYLSELSGMTFID